MRRSRLLLGFFILAALVGGAAGCQVGGCPAALLTGTLAAQGGELVVRDDRGANQPVTWPDGYGVRDDAGRLVLADGFGSVKGGVGDRIDMGGGVGVDGRFHGCGSLIVHPAPSG